MNKSPENSEAPLEADRYFKDPLTSSLQYQEEWPGCRCWLFPGDLFSCAPLLDSDNKLALTLICIHPLILD